MLNHWYEKIPTDPLHDVQKVAEVGTKEQVIKIVNGIDSRSNRPVMWNPLQLVLSWSDESAITTVAEELILLGADVNGVALCGLNALHTLILLLYFRKNPHDGRMIEWWMSKGADVHAHCVIFDKRQKTYRILSPLDIMVCLYSKTLYVEISSYLPAYCLARTRPTIKKQQLKRLVALLVCHGARSSEPSTLLDEIMRSLSTLSFRSYAFLRDYVEVRCKLPLSLSLADIRHRLRFLENCRTHLDHDEILRHRDRRLYPPDEEAVYTNPNFEATAEFMPYEFLGYVDLHRKHYYFHKAMVPSILQSGENPFTREEIPPATRRQWFRELSGRPYSFQQVFMLREVTTETGEFCLWCPVGVADDSKKNFALHFAHGVLSHNFPYTNILHVSTLHAHKTRYLCDVLSREPYLLRRYAPCPSTDPLFFFSQQTLTYIMDDDAPLDLLHFGVEDALQDISCHHLIEKILSTSSTTFRDPFLDVIINVPEVGDVIRDRLGYVHLGYFHEIWQRLVLMNDNFC